MFFSVLLVAAIIISSCKDNSVSGIEAEESPKQLAPIASSSSAASFAYGTVLLQDNFDIPVAQSGANDYLEDRQAGSELAPVNYTRGNFPSPHILKVENNKLIAHGNYVQSFVPDIDVNTDGGFTVCLDAATYQYNGDQNAIRLGISFGHESASDASSGYDGANHDGYLRIGGKTGTGFISGSSSETFTFDSDTELGKSYKLSLSVATAEIAEGVGYTATLYIDGVEQGEVTGTWSADANGNVANFIGFHAIDGGWTVDNLKITAGTSQNCSLGSGPVQTNVYISDENVLAYDHINAPTTSDWQSMVCKDDGSGSIGLDDPRWTRTEGQTAYNIRPLLGSDGLHPFEKWWSGIYSPSNFGEGEWINSANVATSPEMNPNGDGYNWTRYEMPVEGNGTFKVSLIADNCSWVYLDDQLIGYQDDAGLGDPNTPITYGVTLDGSATLSFIIFDGGGAPGGKFRLETTTEDVPEFEPSTNTAPVADGGVDQTVTATGQTTSVSLDGSGSSDADGDALSYSWSLNSSEVSTSASFSADLPDGSYTYTLTVSDGEDTDSDEVTITVENTVPVADAGADRTIEATGPSTFVTLAGSGTDADGDSPLTYSWSDGSTGATQNVDLGVGTHIFTLTVTDPQGASHSDDVTITIVDTTDPELGFDVEKTELWSPNHKMHLVVSGISISDIADPNPALNVTVTSDESQNGRGDGNTGSDWNVIDNGDGTFDVEVRAERDGRGDGRIYTITMSGSDASGNSIEESVEVTVPKSQKGGKKR